MEKALAAGAPHAENTAWCCAQLALIHFSHGNVLAADQVLEKALAKTPDNFHLLAARGKVKAGLNDFPGAIACYQKASAIAPQHEVVAALSDLYRATGNVLEATKQEARLEAIHKLNKANGVRGDSQLAQFYADHDRNLPEALQMAEEEYKTRKNVFVADTLAWCYFKNGRYQEAKQAIQKALRKRTPEARFLFHAGMIHAELGERRAAQLNLYQAMSLNPNFSPIDGPRAAERLQELGSRPPDAKPVALSGAQP
jgi:tetratricopeptide (TPR) repeat protein